MSDIITVLNTPSSVAVSFTWSPATTFTYAPSGHPGFTAPGCLATVPLTFTAAVVIDDVTGTLTIIEYRWDFGDGAVGYGPTTTHTYPLTNPYVTTVLKVTDSLGRDWFTRQQMYVS